MYINIIYIDRKNHINHLIRGYTELHVPVNPIGIARQIMVSEQTRGLTV